MAGLRRRDREITDPDAVAAIIAAARVCHLGMCDGDRPYVVPVSHGFEPGAIYFHAAPAGRKHEILTLNPAVCCQFETDVRLITHPEKPCRWSFAYRSVIAEGTAVRLVEPAAMQHGLALIMRQYSTRDWEIPAEALAAVAVWRVDFHTVRGKESLQKESLQKESPHEAAGPDGDA
jgi:nitroimidazol reductase NimA-like FMN-containing flavoprotein (pyridoxamine 5'-phosphate oxidase superfamily)